MATFHDSYVPIYWSRVIDWPMMLDDEERVYRAQCSFDGKYHCPVPGCMGTAGTTWNLRRHFCLRHPSSLVKTPEEGVYPRCGLCSMQTNPFVLLRTHEGTALCRDGHQRRVQRENASRAVEAQEKRFTARGEELEQVEVFKYLGRLLSHDNNDDLAIWANVRKARKCWARVSRVLRAENATPWVMGMFYKATVQMVLLFGAETWNLTERALKMLKGFHTKAA